MVTIFGKKSDGTVPSVGLWGVIKNSLLILVFLEGRTGLLTKTAGQPADTKAVVFASAGVYRRGDVALEVVFGAVKGAEPVGLCLGGSVVVSGRDDGLAGRRDTASEGAQAYLDGQGEVMGAGPVAVVVVDGHVSLQAVCGGAGFKGDRAATRAFTADGRAGSRRARAVLPRRRLRRIARKTAAGQTEAVSARPGVLAGSISA